MSNSTQLETISMHISSLLGHLRAKIELHCNVNSHNGALTYHFRGKTLPEAFLNSPTYIEVYSYIYDHRVYL